MSYRLVAKARLETCLSTFDSSEETLIEQCVYDSNDYTSAFLQVRNDYNYYIWNPALECSLQVAHEELRDAGEIFKQILIALYLTHHLRLAGYFGYSNLSDKSFYSNDDTIKIMCLLVRHLQSCTCNAYDLVQEGETSELGGAIFTTISLSNHSCAPNTIRKNERRHCVVRATETIKKGQEVSDNYGYFYHATSKAKRQSALKKQYHFVCQCKACLENWPATDAEDDASDVNLFDTKIEEIQDVMGFGEFYGQIRSYFSNNGWDYDRYKMALGNKGKVKFLIEHNTVKNALKDLEKRNIRAPCSASPKQNGDISDKKLPKPKVKGSAKYPQMSKKVEVKVTKKKGRILVAKEKIDPGEQTVYIRIICHSGI